MNTNTFKTARLFQNGGSQSVRLPAEFRFEGSEVLIRRDPRTGEVVLSPMRDTSWAAFAALRGQLADGLAAEGLQDYMQDRHQPMDAPRDPFSDGVERKSGEGGA